MVHMGEEYFQIYLYNLKTAESCVLQTRVSQDKILTPFTREWSWDLLRNLVSNQLSNQSWTPTVAASMTADVICNLEEPLLRLSFTLLSRIGTGNGMWVLNSCMDVLLGARDENSGMPWMYPLLRNALFTLRLPSTSSPSDKKFKISTHSVIPSPRHHMRQKYSKSNT